MDKPPDNSNAAPNINLRRMFLLFYSIVISRSIHTSWTKERTVYGIQYPKVLPGTYACSSVPCNLVPTIYEMMLADIHPTYKSTHLTTSCCSTVPSGLTLRASDEVTPSPSSSSSSTEIISSVASGSPGPSSNLRLAPAKISPTASS
jgi:hypothetical protein